MLQPNNCGRVEQRIIDGEAQGLRLGPRQHCSHETRLRLTQRFVNLPPGEPRLLVPAHLRHVAAKLHRALDALLKLTYNPGVKLAVFIIRQVLGPTYTGPQEAIPEAVCLFRFRQTTEKFISGDVPDNRNMRACRRGWGRARPHFRPAIQPDNRPSGLAYDSGRTDLDTPSPEESNPATV